MKTNCNVPVKYGKQPIHLSSVVMIYSYNSWHIDLYIKFIGYRKTNCIFAKQIQIHNSSSKIEIGLDRFLPLGPNRMHKLLVIDNRNKVFHLQLL